MNSNTSDIKCIYVSRVTLPSKSASSIHLMKICDELYSIFDGSFRVIVNSCDVNDEELCKIYGTDNIIVHSLELDLNSKLYPYYFAIKVAEFVRKNKIQMIITRDPLTALVMTIMNRNVVLDLHGDLRHLCGRVYHLFKIPRLIRKPNLNIVTISHGLKEFYLNKYNIAYDKAVVLPDGVTLENFDNIENNSWRNNEKLVIGYIGKFSIGKGIDTVIKVAKRCPQYRFVLCGGTKGEAETETGISIPDNIEFRGYVQNAEIPLIMKEMSVMLLPNKSNQNCNGEQIGSFTSPLKMFEYMASGSIIIASNIPVLKEILNEKNCYFAQEDSIEEWVEMLKYIDLNRDEASSIASQAQEDVKKYTWNCRAYEMYNLVNLGR